MALWKKLKHVARFEL